MLGLTLPAASAVVGGLNTAFTGVTKIYTAYNITRLGVDLVTEDSFRLDSAKSSYLSAKAEYETRTGTTVPLI